MQRRVITCLGLAVMLGCRDQSTMTSLKSPAIAATLQDGGHGGNPHFFFLPPIASTPTPNGPFNPRLGPVVEICSTLEAPCATAHVLTTLAPVLVQDTAQYHVNWDSKPLNLPVGMSVRIVVRVGTTHILGFADVDLVSNAGGSNRQASSNLQLVDGQTLPIKFRIEQGALTPDQSCTDCAEQTISTSTGSATVVTNTQFAGAFFPQGSLPQDVTVIIEATAPAEGQTCIPVDLDQFPGCYTFSTDPGPTTFNTNVTAGICVETDGLTPDEVTSLILYQLDVVSERNVITPLENTPATFLPCNTLAAARRSNGLLARARDALLRLLMPAPLHAAHLGVGGLTGSFSKIGWGRPPTMTKVLGDGQTAAPGTALPIPPTVQLINRFERPVAGLPVTFQITAGGGTIAGSTAAATVRTGSDGRASVAWTIGSTSGSNSLAAREIGALGSPVTFTATGAVGLTVPRVSSGFVHACDLATTGAAFCWGNNFHGQLGNGSTTNSPVSPVAVSGGITFATISSGQSHSCGLTAAETAYCWGDNIVGQLGVGSTAGPELCGPSGATFGCSTTPVAVPGGLTFAAISAGGGYTCGVTPAGVAYCWGDGRFGELGVGSTSGLQQCGPSGSVAACSVSPVAVAGGLTFTAISAGHSSPTTCGLTPGGAAYCWGHNFYGEVGNGSTTNDFAAPVAVSGGLTFTAVSPGFSHTCGLTPGGVAYCWGDNGAGELGDGSTTNSAVPVPVSGGLTFAAISAGDSLSCGVTPSGAGYCWGFNAFGQVGNGSTANSTVPTAVSGGLSFAAISSGFRFACGVTTGAVAYCWGYNGFGELGNGTTNNSLVPVRVVQ